jgi:integrase
VRDRILTPEERALIVASIRDQPFADYFLALTLMGCRPGEVAKVTAEQVSIERGIWILPIHNTAKRTDKPRIIYLSPEALA